jgi:hypothetical protein
MFTPTLIRKNSVKQDEDTDRCPVCEGEGEVRGAWNVTHWKMIRCSNCDGTGRVPFMEPADIILDCCKRVMPNDDVTSAEVATEIYNMLIKRDLFILRSKHIKQKEIILTSIQEYLRISSELKSILQTLQDK